MAQIDKNAYIAKTAVIEGDITIEKDANIWHNAVVRADIAPIHIGEGSNIQDGCIVHVNFDMPVEIGKGVTIGHGAIVHGCTIGDNSLIGMGAIVMDGAHIGNNCIIGGATLVTQNKVIPDGHMAFGNPVKIIRKLAEDEIEATRQNSLLYIKEAQKQLV